MIDIFGKLEKLKKPAGTSTIPSRQNFIQNGPQLILQSHFQELRGLFDYMGGIVHI